MLPRIGELLVEAGAISREQLGEALRHQARTGARLGTALTELRFIDERRLCSVLAQQLRMPSVGSEQLERASLEALGRVAGHIAERLRAVPVREDAGRLWVAMADPTDRDAIDELERVGGLAVRPMVAPDQTIDAALLKHYRIAPKPRAERRLDEPLGAFAPSAQAVSPFAPSDPRTPAPVRVAPTRPQPPAPPRDAYSENPLYAQAPPSARLPVKSPAPPTGPPPIAAAPLPLGALDAMTGFLDEAKPPPRRAVATRRSFDEALQLLIGATAEQTVLDTAIDFVAQDAMGAALFFLRDGELSVHAVRGVDLAGVRRSRVRLDELQRVGESLRTGATFTGLLAPADLGSFAPALGLTAELTGVIVPLRVARRPVGCVVGVDVSQAALDARADFDRLATKLDLALHILQLRRQLIAP